MKDGNIEILVGAPLLIGAIVVLKKFVDYLKEKGKSFSLADFDDLVKNQKTVDELNANEITGWIKDTQKNASEQLVYILAYPTKEILQKYRLKNFPDEMDIEHNMIFLALSEKTYKPVKIQMISFGFMNPELKKELFKGEDYAVITE